MKGESREGGRASPGNGNERWASRLSGRSLLNLIRRLCVSLKALRERLRLDKGSARMPHASDDLKDLYAHFGLTFSLACSVEGWLVNAILASDFVKEMLAESRKAGKPIYDKEECERRFEEFLTKQRDKNKTMGILLGDLQKLAVLERGLKERGGDALRRRNYLAHAFWRERGGEVISRKRRPLVMEDLIRDGEFFEQLGKELENWTNQEVKKLGLDATKLRARVDEEVRQTLEQQ